MSIQADIDYILQQSLDAATPADELALLRISLRAYAEGMTAQDAIQWAARELAKSIAQC